MGKANHETVHAISSEGTGYFYSFRRKKGKAKLALRKYDPRARKYVLFQEKKMSRLKRKFVFGAAKVEVADEPESTEAASA